MDRHLSLLSLSDFQGKQHFFTVAPYATGTRHYLAYAFSVEKNNLVNLVRIYRACFVLGKATPLHKIVLLCTYKLRRNYTGKNQRNLDIIFY